MTSVDGGRDDAEPVRIVGAVLTGGASRRMGRPKALIDHPGGEGLVLVEHVGSVLAAAGCAPIVLIGLPPGVDPTGFGELAGRHGWTVVHDRFPGEGPLGGVLSALDAAGGGGADVVVAACDLPDLDVETVTTLLGQRADGVQAVAAVTDRLEPLLCRWAPAAASVVAAAFDDGVRSMFGALGRLAVEGRPVRAGALRNVNTPDDLGR